MLTSNLSERRYKESQRQYRQLLINNKDLKDEYYKAYQKFEIIDNQSYEIRS